MKRSNGIDITGKKFGRLTAIAFSHFEKYQYWMFVCECGKEKIIGRHLVVGGKTKSCGCLHAESVKVNCKTHGLSKTTEHKIWLNMLTRCYNKNRKQYKDWGGRGIVVCDRWRNDFMSFYLDMGRRPSKDHSLDRIDPNGNYEPSNCRWATKQEQAQNKRTYKTNKIGVAGVYQRKRTGKWIARIQLNGKRHDLGEFKNMQDAINARKQAEVELNGGVIGKAGDEVVACDGAVTFKFGRVR